jgi:hypothetical protein
LAGQPVQFPAQEQRPQASLVEGKYDSCDLPVYDDSRDDVSCNLPVCDDLPVYDDSCDLPVYDMIPVICLCTI